MIRPAFARPRLAVIGAGIAGLSAAWMLRERFAVTLFEAEPRAGGHADTQMVFIGGDAVAVDTGFIVYNTTNYPNLTALFDLLGVRTRASEMSFGVSIGAGATEYAGGEIAQMFAQKRNLLRPRFWSMIRDIMRFYREAPALLQTDDDMSLGEYLDRNRYGDAFALDHILPMGAAIWSASVASMRDFPARHFVRFFVNHGLLRLTDRPQWRTVEGGSRQYVARILQDLGDVRLGRPVVGVGRTPHGVQVATDAGSEEFAQVVLACHADQALALIDRPTDGEAAVLGAIRCQDNLAVLHTDLRLMPRRRAVWSAWNYLASDRPDHGRAVSLTYWMNRLQGMDTPDPLLVTLNPLTPPDPARVLRSRAYRHPQFDAAAIAAQQRLPSIQGRDRLWFAGAWTGWGFHEDGIAAAAGVATALGAAPPWQAIERPAAA